MSINAASIDTGLGFDPATRLFTQLIDGQLVRGAGEIPVVDPASDAPFATAPTANAEQLDLAVAAARRAAVSWRRTAWDERAAIVGRVADVLEANLEVLAKLTTLEQGKPLAEARDDVQWAADFARHFAGTRLDPKIARDDADAYVEIRYDPIGVVGAICPWNFPLFQAVYKLAPALVTGNTMVLKPAPTTPIATLYFAELIAEVVPAGVFNVVGDSGDLGRLLTDHPGIDKVSFTGSTAVGRRVMAASAPQLKRLTLELGGNDAAIVLDDADIEKTAKGIYTWSFANAGQVCVSIKRIYAPASIYDDLASEIARLASETILGHGLDPATGMGPVQNSRQYSAAAEWLRLAAAHGNVIAGGSLEDRPGYFVQPTVVRDITEDNPLLTEETFGPVRSIVKYDDIEDALARANNTPYGLGGSVWGTDVERATAVASRLETGTSWVNHHFALTPDVPFGGHKQSGIGVEFGTEGLQEFTEVHVVNVSRS
ncbi:MAG: aldehyde dehydrogenase family protein [Rhodococcus sp. (in: high G+C Gram-positive bacteria)]